MLLQSGQKISDVPAVTRALSPLHLVCGGISVPFDAAS